MSLFKSEKFLIISPVICQFLLEGANIGQLFTMWTKHTAAGQNPLSWIGVNIALILWMNWYWNNAKGRIAFWSTFVGWCLNTSVILTVIYFQNFYSSVQF